MNSPSSTSSSHTYKHLQSKHKHSPIEIKEKMRKTYKDKVQNCRSMLLNRLRGSIEETELRNTLTEIYKSMYNFSENPAEDDEEIQMLEEIKNELVQEELHWWLQEYEKSQFLNVDWSSIEEDDSVICPVCQKANFSLQSNTLSCSYCKITLKCNKSLMEIKNSVISSVERHSSACNGDVQFAVVQEINEAHVYLICDSCLEMQAIV